MIKTAEFIFIYNDLEPKLSKISDFVNVEFYYMAFPVQNK